MNEHKKTFILIIICTFLLIPQAGKAATASQVTDKAIHYTAKTAYYVTKYTLKTCCFITKKTFKGIKIVSQNVYRAVKDSRSPGVKLKPVPNRQDVYIQNNTLPPPPPILD